jgi:ornithine--oxo-acid transaminase
MFFKKIRQRSREGLRDTQSVIAEAESYSAHNYHPLPVVLSRGEGVWVWDAEGRKYLDCLSAYSAVNQGHCHPRILEALKDQAAHLTLSSRAFHNDQMGAFLKKLCDFADFEQALPMNSGAEAVETALKIARKWGYKKKHVAEDAAEIIVAADNFHGRTVTVVSFSSEPSYREGFGPFTPGFKVVPYKDAAAIEAAITERTVAVLLEPIQGEAGIIVPPAGYLLEVQKICHKHQVLFCLDEIQTGLGRTGKRFCFDHELRESPDILILGKALSGGFYPVSAVLADRDIMSVIGPGEHGSTFGGNPLGSAVAKAALDVLVDEKLAERAAELGEYLMVKVGQFRHPRIKEVRGRGLLVGIEIKKGHGAAREYCEKLMQEGVLAKDTHEQTIRIAPPLVIKKREIDWLLERLDKVLES